MSNITTIIDGINTRLAAILTPGAGYSELINAYQVNEENNTPQSLAQGWGLTIENGSRGERLISCQFAIIRSFTVILTRRSVSLKSDQTTRTNVQKSLLEDQFLVIQDFETSPKLGIDANIMNTEYDTDSGILLLNAEDFSFLKLETNFTIEYLEDFS